MNEKMSFKMGMKFAVPVYIIRTFKIMLYEVRDKSAKTKLQIM